MRLRGPRLSFGLTGPHVAGPRVYFGGRRRRSVSVSVTVSQPAPVEPPHSPVPVPAGWGDVHRVEFRPNGPDASFVVFHRPQGETRLDFDYPVERLKGSISHWLVNFKVEDQAAEGTTASRRGA